MNQTIIQVFGSYFLCSDKFPLGWRFQWYIIHAYSMYEKGLLEVKTDQKTDHFGKKVRFPDFRRQTGPKYQLCNWGINHFFPAQFKNKNNLINLVFHDHDFGRTASWTFHATAHGKAGISSPPLNVFNLPPTIRVKVQRNIIWKKVREALKKGSIS